MSNYDIIGIESRDVMKKDNILGIVVMGCGLLLVLSIFLPYVSYYTSSMSLWESEAPSRFMYILLGVFVIVLYLLNKKTELSYLTAGFGTFTSISQIISFEGLEYFNIGFYLILLTSIAIGVITFLYDESKADSLINFSVKVNKNTMNNSMYNQQNNNYGQPMNNQMYNQMNNTMYGQQPMNPNMGMNNQSMDSNMGMNNQMNNQHSMKFDPNTGEPLYNQNNNY